MVRYKTNCSYISIAKQPYSEGFSCQMKRNMASGYVDLAVPQGANTFSVIAGQSDSSHDTDIIVTFEVVDATVVKFFKQVTCLSASQFPLL